MKRVLSCIFGLAFILMCIITFSILPSISDSDKQVIYFILGCVSVVIVILQLIVLNEVIPFYFWFVSLGFKKIFLNDMGTFYSCMIGDKIYIYEQKLLYMQLVFSVYHTDDMKQTSDIIKDKLTDLYKEKIQERKKRERISSSYRMWDGYLDIPSKREDKIRKIIQ